MSDKKVTITDNKIEKYITQTENALKHLKIIVPRRSHMFKIAEDFLDMASRYYKDALHFYKESEDYVTAFAAVNYAYGWIDSGVRLGLFDVGDDDQNFTLYK